ncbi:Hypothetical predicted protein [Lecanosticta acicola]|uniref:Uncharacterized protein n=1 Tax=Lecanosticta acicola TaxID=111012 RepID=A0AAI8YYK0_9PEZI|nr:Hypothetical predicted protein [Lecanosticta acicola]
MEDEDTNLNAAARVLGIVELLERILSYLPMFKLFVLQSTNMTFHNTIQNSLQLRRTMFLTPDPPPGRDLCSRVFNPLLESTAFAPRNQDKRFAKKAFISQSSSSSGFGFSVHSEVSPDIYEAPDIGQPAEFSTLLAWHSDLLYKRSLPRHPDIIESWQYMVPVQPALKAIPIKLFRLYQRRGKHRMRNFMTAKRFVVTENPVSGGGPIRLQDLYESLGRKYERSWMLKYGAPREEEAKEDDVELSPAEEDDVLDDFDFDTFLNQPGYQDPGSPALDLGTNLDAGLRAVEDVGGLQYDLCGLVGL